MNGNGELFWERERNIKGQDVFAGQMEDRDKNKYICETLRGADETLKQEKGKDRFL